MLISTAHAAGVIDDAPSIAHGLDNVFRFLLQVVGVIGMIGIVVAGMLYLLAAGNEKAIETAKKMWQACLIGFLIAFGAWILIQTIASFFK